MDINSLPDNFTNELLSCGTVEEAINYALASGISQDEITAFIAEEGDDLNGSWACPTAEEKWIKKDQEADHSCENCWTRLRASQRGYSEGTLCRLSFSCPQCWAEYDHYHDTKTGDDYWVMVLGPSWKLIE